MRLRQASGFSLIELMIVVAIIGVLSTVAVPSYSNYVKRSAFARELTLVDQYKKAISLCFQTTGDSVVCRTQGSASGIPQDLDEGEGNNAIAIQYRTNLGPDIVRLTVTLYGENPTGSSYIRDFHYYDISSGQWSLNLGQSNCDEAGYCGS